MFVVGYPHAVKGLPIHPLSCVATRIKQIEHFPIGQVINICPSTVTSISGSIHRNRIARRVAPGLARFYNGMRKNAFPVQATSFSSQQQFSQAGSRLMLGASFFPRKKCLVPLINANGFIPGAGCNGRWRVGPHKPNRR